MLRYTSIIYQSGAEGSNGGDGGGTAIWPTLFCYTHIIYVQVWKEDMLFLRLLHPINVMMVISSDVPYYIILYVKQNPCPPRKGHCIGRNPFYHTSQRGKDYIGTSLLFQYGL